MAKTLFRVVSSMGTFGMLHGIWRHLSYRRRIQLGFLLGVMILSALAELVSLAAVYPFLGVLSNPDDFWKQKHIKDFAIQFGYQSVSDILLPLTLLFVCAAV